MTSVKTGTELARGALVNIIALVTANLRAIFILLIARALGKTALGTFALAAAITDWLATLGVFGLDTGAMTLVAKKHAVGDLKTARRLLTRAVGWGLAISGATAAVGIVVLQSFGGRLGQSSTVVLAASVLLLSLPCTAVYNVSNGVSRGMRVMAHDIYSRGLTETLTTIAALLVAMALGFRTMAPVVAVLAGTTARGLVAFALARGLFKGVGAAASIEAVSRPLLRFSAPIGVYGQLNTLISKMDVILLGVFLGRATGVTIEQLGVFVATVEVAGGMRKVRQAFDPIFGPVLARQSLVQQDTDAQESFARLARWVLAAQVPLVGVLCLSGGVVLSIFGPGFEQGALWLGVLALAHGTSSFVGLAETVIMVHRPGLNLLNSAITALLQCVCSIGLISWKGTTGAALGMLFAYLTQGVLRYVELRAVLRWRWPWRALRRPAVAGLMAIVPAMIVRLLSGSWTGQLWAGLLFLGSYVVAWRILGLEDSDRAILAELRARPGRVGHV